MIEPITAMAKVLIQCNKNKFTYKKLNVFIGELKIAVVN